MKLFKSQKGSILISLIITFPFLIIIIVSYLGLSVSSLTVARKDQFITHSQFAADAGVEVSLNEINTDDTWTGSGGEIELLDDGNVRTTYEVTVNEVDDENKEVVSVGRTYWPAGSSTPKSSITLTTTVTSVTSGDFSIVTGVGGLIMQNSARVLGGEIYVNGSLSMTNTAQIGLSFDPVTINVAHQDCPNPADATYPRLCNSGENGQPISISNQAHIYGTVNANNQVSGAGMSDPGLSATTGVTPQALPDHDRNAQIAAVAQEITGADASCTGNETKTIAANTKVNGNVTAAQNCHIVVEGDLWITGTFRLTNSSNLDISDAVGDQEANIMIDGAGGVEIRNSSSINSNSFDRGAKLITYWSDATCSPGCADVTGTDLDDSRYITTITIDNTTAAAETIFYAKWSQVELVNSTAVGALVGQTVFLRNSGTITFGSSVSLTNTYWIISGYRRTF
jgi:hypothetical protein